MDTPALITSLSAKTLIFTVTSGRSGTKLLAALLGECLGIDAEHEPAPRVNFVFRSIINAPDAAMSWLVHEKLPAMLARASGPVYTETSHLFCKGLIEPILELGLRPKFIILTRPAREVARSLFQMNAIPERTGGGRLVLLGPSDPGVLPLPHWERLSDYQLCYWYAREIERRQSTYAALFRTLGLAAFWIEMRALTDWTTFGSLADFVAGELGFVPNEQAFWRVTLRNQNARGAATGRTHDRELPRDLDFQEQMVDEAIRTAGSEAVISQLLRAH